MVKPRLQVDAFFAILRAGLWEQGVRLMPFDPLDFEALYELADEQSVIGLLAAGLEHVEDRKVTKPEAIKFLKKVFALEGQNSDMNGFIEKMFERLRLAGIDAVMVKGQGVAQCYERPQWRSYGDVDLLVEEDNYSREKEVLGAWAESVDVEDVDKKHIGMTIDAWTVELHGTLHNGLSRRADRVIDEIQDDTVRGGNIRMWRNGGIDIPLPGVDNDVLFVFTHFLQHFFHGGIGLRQVCDWSRLLWTYRESINIDLLESRVRRMGLISEWKAFAFLAVHYLGHPCTAMPMYSASQINQRKADRVLKLILKKGHQRSSSDSGHRENTSILRRKIHTIWRQLKESVSFLEIFPLDSLRFLGFFFVEGFQRTKHTTKIVG